MAAEHIWQAYLILLAAAKSLQSCPTLRDPRGGSPAGSRVPGILQPRALEWVPFPAPRQETDNTKVRLKKQELYRTALKNTLWNLKLKNVKALLQTNPVKIYKGPFRNLRAYPSSAMGKLIVDTALVKTPVETLLWLPSKKEREKNKHVWKVR